MDFNWSHTEKGQEKHSHFSGRGVFAHCILYMYTVYRYTAQCIHMIVRKPNMPGVILLLYIIIEYIFNNKIILGMLGFVTIMCIHCTVYLYTVYSVQTHPCPRNVLTWTPGGKRKRGHPKETYRRTVEREREQLGFHSWDAAAAVAGDRKKWRDVIAGPILHREIRT